MTTNGKRDLRNRVLSAQGHLGAITDMIDGDAPCVDILRQLQAVCGAIHAINRKLLCAYLLDEDCRLRASHRNQRERAWKQVRRIIVEENHRKRTAA